MKKRKLAFVLVLLFLVLLLVSTSFIKTTGTHSSSVVIVNVDGISKGWDLITLDDLTGSHTYTSSVFSIPGHDVSQIWVSVQDGEMNLLAALQSTDRLCPNSTKPTTYSSASIPTVSHTGMEIELSSGITLQEAINDGAYCPASNSECTGQASGTDCNFQTGSCGSGYDGILVPGLGGTTICVTPTGKCDGSGNCIGWTGIGCSGCPFGTTRYSTMGGYPYNTACNKNGNQMAFKYTTGIWTTWSYSEARYCKHEEEVSCGLTCTDVETTNYEWRIKP
jgi:hypothetical protein